ncbi:DUF6186 family protein [Tenggerimyces flavus]|uniref:DUF6186 family protein n=1 Tax=Tenggerimyces flavus TaxID=1708749 RepID=A0ABV7YLS1_9ACTN|nr:DUF6186 family protein [Tenggerimyces flavus]MBM7787518.1 hypothetical protein [Tenggerimyces flavus]
MTLRTLTVVVFILMGTIAVVLVVLPYLRRGALAPAGETFTRLTRTRPARLAFVLVWAWLGWHFLAR